MKEYGIAVADKTTGSKVEVYFTPMSYADWSAYSGSTESYDKASIRYILKKYVVNAIRYTKDEGSVILTSNELSEIVPGLLKEVIDKMIEKSGFSNMSEFSATIEKLKTNASTLPGAYDLFIFLNTNVEIYLSCLEKNVFERAAIIAAIEKITGIDVKERFELSISRNVDLDLVTPPSSYRPKRNGRAASSLRDQIDESAREKKQPAHELDESQLSAFNESRQSLQEALRRGKKNPTSFYDWTKDNAEFGDFENNPGTEIDPL